jgi:hypothetical protein
MKELCQSAFLGSLPGLPSGECTQMDQMERVSGDRFETGHNQNRGVILQKYSTGINLGRIVNKPKKQVLIATSFNSQ